MLNAEIKQKIIKKYQTHPSDTGSSQVQIAILTEEIKQLTEHLKIHKKDQSSRRGLLKKVNERRRLLKYLKREDITSFNDIAQKLKLKVKTIQEKSLDDIEQEFLAQQQEKAEWEELAVSGGGEAAKKPKDET